MLHWKFHISYVIYIEYAGNGIGTGCKHGAFVPLPAGQNVRDQAKCTEVSTFLSHIVAQERQRAMTSHKPAMTSVLAALRPFTHGSTLPEEANHMRR